jgi:hypothetical protein
MSNVHSITVLSDEAFGWHFTGLVDGEGYFGVGRNRKTKNWGVCFQIEMRYDEIDHITAIKQRMNCGNIHFLKTYTRPNAKPCLRWVVSKGLDLANVIVPHFDRFPLQLKKARDFPVWKACVLLYFKVGQRSGRGPRCKVWTTEENAFMADSMAQLKAIRQYDSQITPVPKSQSTGNGHFPLFPGFSES